MLKLISKQIKMPFRLRENILAVYSPRKCVISEADTVTGDTEIKIVLSLKTTLYVTTKFKGQKIKEISGPQNKRLRITLLNTSYFDKHVIEKGSVIGYVLSPNSKISIQKHAQKSHRLPRRYLTKGWNCKKFWQDKKAS